GSRRNRRGADCPHSNRVPAGLDVLRLRLGLVRGDVWLRGLLQSLLEGLHPLAEASHDLGQPASPEDDQHDDQYHQELADSQAEHDTMIGVPRPAGKSRRAWPVTYGLTRYASLRCPGPLPILRASPAAELSCRLRAAPAAPR